MVYIKNFKQVSLQEKSLEYYYLNWKSFDKSHWFSELHKIEHDQIILGPTCLAGWS